METINTYLQELIDAGTEIQATDIKAFQMENPAFLADHVVLMTAKNNIDIKAISEELGKKSCSLMKKIPSPDIYEETLTSGTTASGWMILDLNSIMVHIMTPEMREFYALDTLLESKSIVFHH